MTIRKLREAIEAGTADEGHFARAFPSESAYGRCTWHDAIDAYRKNSLDAALALMQAVLPEWRVGALHQFESGRWYAKIYRPMGDDWPKWTPYPEHEASNDNPARALLLCEFKALEAQEEIGKPSVHLGNQPEGGSQ